MKLPFTTFILFFIGIFLLIFGGLWFWSGRSDVSRRANFVSPLASEKPIPTPTSSLYANVLRKHTVIGTDKNQYFPAVFAMDEPKDAVDIDVSSYIVFDRDTREVLLGKNITKRLPIASTTKIATAIVALENAPVDLELSVSSQAAKVGEATMGLSAGEEITVEEALYGAMLPSGNDAAEVLAEGVGKYKLGTPQEDIDGGGARQWFLDRMNQKMQDLGLFDSYFFNPSGLDEESLSTSNFSTALDLAILTNFALNNPTFAQIAATSEKIIPYVRNKHKALYLYNILTFNSSYPGIKGVKPGDSDLAGETLVSCIEKDGRRIIVVILGSQHTKDDVVAIYDEIFGKKTS